MSGPESVDRLFDEMARGLLRGFVAGPLQELMEELQRQAGERVGQGGACCTVTQTWI